MQSSIPVIPDALPPSPDELTALMLESRENLKSMLRDILDKKEYQAFLDALDQKEGMAAFAEKRKPQFKNR